MTKYRIKNENSLNHILIVGGGLLLLILILLLGGCDDSDYNGVNLTNQYRLPEDLKDCKVYYLPSPHSADLSVVRCPMSSTTTNYEIRRGKSRTFYTNTVIS